MASNSWWPSSSSDEEEMFFANVVVKAAEILLEEEKEEEDGSSENVITRRIRINRDRQGAHEKLVNDYFLDAPLYNADIFKRRFRMSRRLFTRIADDLAGLDPFFTQRSNARNYEGFTTLQKCTAAIRQLAYGTVADALDEYLQMSARTSRECLYRFCHNVVKLYSKQYLRKPNVCDVQQLYEAHEARHRFPGMLGSIDCMHWAWHNCPTAWRGQYTRDEGRAICEYDENASYGNTVPVDPTQQDLNSFALTNDFTHANLQQDLVEHIWNSVNVGDGDGDEDE
ncbi:uncharacterized protein LOC110931239 [Helianthus annuus]|uniref:uncharacterized protein LOC110931239 n=1 Tax=Helianthus annuus TaxID=4232 RepID=UPI001653154E|nr:uncharacterized protein LOC110931239 [Helianthus annuus]